MKRIFLSSVCAAVLFAIFSSNIILPASSSYASLKLDDFVQKGSLSKITGTNDSVEEDISLSSTLLQNEDDIKYYAYLDLSTAEESLHSVILEARKIIIYRSSWVADGQVGYVFDENGKIVEKVPNFSDLFPPDWEEPIESIEVDLSYYSVS